MSVDFRSESFSQDESNTKEMTNSELDSSLSQSESLPTLAHFGRFEEIEDTEPKMSMQFLNKLLCSNFRLYYRTYDLNEVLYLHFKGFRKIENLVLFSNLKVLYLESNSIQEISGLETNTQLMSLYLHQNMIKKIENLDFCLNLTNLNLSENMIETIENLDKLTKLQNLTLKRNRIGHNGISDFEHIKLLKSVTCIDISDNYIKDKEIVDCFKEMSSLRVIYLHGNEVVRKISYYRKTLIATLPSMTYLDDKPVFEDEKRLAEAFAVGGTEAERNERTKMKEEERENHRKRLEEFKEFLGEKKAEEILDDEDKRKEKEELKKRMEEKARELKVKKQEERLKTTIFDQSELIDVIKKTEENLKPTKKEMEPLEEDMPELETTEVLQEKSKNEFEELD